MTFEEALESAVTDLDLLTDGSDPESLAAILRRHFAPPPRERGFDLAELEACARQAIQMGGSAAQRMVELTGPEAMAIVGHIQATERLCAEAIEQQRIQMKGQHWVTSNHSFTLQEGEGIQVALKGPAIYSIEKRDLPK